MLHYISHIDSDQAPICISDEAIFTYQSGETFCYGVQIKGRLSKKHQIKELSSYYLLLLIRIYFNWGGGAVG